MKPFPSYKESGIELIGNIPHHWGMIPLKYLTKKNGIVRGPFGSSLKIEFFVENGYKVYEQKNAIYKDIGLGNYFIDEEKFRELERFSVNENDLIISCSGTIGKIFKIPKNFVPGVINQALLKLTLTDRMSVEYFCYIFESYIYENLVVDKTQGGAMKNLVGIDTFKSLKFIVPPLPEQQQIVSVLDKKTQQIDDLIQKTEQKIELLKEKRTSLINHCVTKGLDPNVEMKDSGVEWIGEIPSHWEMLKLKYFSVITLGKMLTPLDKGGYHLKPYLRSQNIQINFVDITDIKEMWFSDDELIKYRLKREDLLVNEGGDVGRTSMWMGELDECYIQNSVNRVDISDGNKKYYLYHFYLHHQTGYFDSIVNRVSIPHLTKEKLEDVLFIKPPESEQQNIVEYLDLQTKKIDNTINKETERIELLKEYRQSLISEVVTGKIDV